MTKSKRPKYQQGRKDQERGVKASLPGETRYTAQLDRAVDDAERRLTAKRHKHKWERLSDDVEQCRHCPATRKPGGVRTPPERRSRNTPRRVYEDMQARLQSDVTPDT